MTTGFCYNKNIVQSLKYVTQKLFDYSVSFNKFKQVIEEILLSLSGRSIDHWC